MQNCKAAAMASNGASEVSAALEHQHLMQASGPEFDYFLVGDKYVCVCVGVRVWRRALNTVPCSDVDFGIKISDPMARVFFHVCKRRAEQHQSLRAVQQMFNMLVATGAEVGLDQARVQKQLTEEWGDFMGAQAMAEPPLDIDEPEVSAMMAEMGLQQPEQQPMY